MKRRVALAACCLAGLLGLGAIDAPALERDPSEFFWRMLDQAKWGEPEAQYAVGMMYLAGEDVERDEKEAAEWLRKASDQNHAPATLKLAELYEKGIGVPKDDAMAMALYKQAAKTDRAASDPYYEQLREAQMQEIQREHQLDMLEKQQAHEAQMQKRALRSAEKIERMRDRYDDDYWDHRRGRYYR